MNRHLSTFNYPRGTARNNPFRFIDPTGKEILFVYVSAASPNPYGHAAIKHVNEKTGEVAYYDAAYDKRGGKDIVINKYTEEEFKKRYGERRFEAVHVDVPNEEGSLKYIAEVVDKKWDYNAVTNNCVSFTTYVIEKGGGKVVSDGSWFENPRRYPRDARDGYKKQNAKKQKKGKNELSFLGFNPDFEEEIRHRILPPLRALN